MRTWENRCRTTIQHQCFYVLAHPTRHHTYLTTFHYVFTAFLTCSVNQFSKFVISSDSYLKVLTHFVFRSTRLYYIVIISNPLEARSTRVYYISTASTSLLSDQQTYRYKYCILMISSFWPSQLESLQLHTVCTTLAQRLERDDVTVDVARSLFLTSFNPSCSV